MKENVKQSNSNWKWCHCCWVIKSNCKYIALHCIEFAGKPINQKWTVNSEKTTDTRIENNTQIGCTLYTVHITHLQRWCYKCNMEWIVHTSTKQTFLYFDKKKRSMKPNCDIFYLVLHYGFTDMCIDCTLNHCVLRVQNY